MNIRFFCFIASLLIITCKVKAQAYIQPGVQSVLDSFILYSNNKEWSKAFDLIYPKLFSQVPKQDIVDMMKSMEQDGLTLAMRNAKIISTTAPIKEGNETFIKVVYTSDVTAHIALGSIYSKSIKELEEGFKATYGKENVKWNEATSDFQVMAKKTMMAINDGSDAWKLVEINMDQPQLMEFLFPANIMDALVKVE
jgi:hypothetical protein